MYKSIQHLVFAFLCLCAITLHAQNPKISIQSTLKDISGKAIPDGPQSVTFKLYKDAIGGNAQWTEQATVEVVGGIYSHKLGSITTLDPSIFDGNLFLGVTVAGGQELAPRTELTYSPYAVAVNSLAGSGKSASFESNGNFKVTGSASFNGNVSSTGNIGGNTINGVSIVRGSDYSQFAGRINAWDNGRTDIHAYNNQNVVLHYNSGIKFYTDGSGTITEGRHYVTQNLDVPNGNLNVSNGNNQNGATKWITLGDSDTGLRSDGDGRLQLMSNTIPVLNVDAANGGRVGIKLGGAQPRVNFEIGYDGYQSGFSNDYVGGHQFQGGYQNYQNNNSVPLGNPQTDMNWVVAIFQGSTVAERGFYSALNLTFSDKRLKNIIGKSNSNKDLSLLNKIKITDYTMKDNIKDNRTYKKVIAQDIQEVFPQAVSKMRNVIPDIFVSASKSKFENKLLTITLEKAHQLTKGDHVDILTKESKLTDVEVIDILDDKTFSIKSEKDLSHVFVYGKYVDDYLSVDYDALSMLNISATQELYNKIVALENENKALKSTTASLEDRMSKIEAMLSDNNTSTSNTNNTSGQK